MRVRPGGKSTTCPQSIDEQIDWDRLRKEFSEIRSTLDFELLDADEFEELRLHRLTYGLAKTSVADRISEGKAIFVWPTHTSAARELWEGLACELGLSVPSCMDTVPQFLKIARPPGLVMQKIEEGFENRFITNSFLSAWARLHALEERFHLLFLSDEASGVTMERALAGAERSVEVQQHWYAHWLRTNSKSLSAQDREDAGSQIAAVCWDIHECRLSPWEPYPTEWFSRLLSPLTRDANPTRTEQLTDSLLKIGEPRLKVLLEHPVLTPAVLPPLSVQEFKSA